MLRFFEEYSKHSALNLGQALQGLRYLFTHPDLDTVAPRGTLAHALLSARLRSKRFSNDLFFALIPPHWHHTPEDLAQLRQLPLSMWFQCGYCPWRFTESGDYRDPLPADVDRRWDPRCAPTGKPHQ